MRKFAVLLALSVMVAPGNVSPVWSTAFSKTDMPVRAAGGRAIVGNPEDASNRPGRAAAAIRGEADVPANGAAAQDRAAEVAAIDALLTSWHKAAAEADEKTYFDLMAPDAIFLGTDLSERWTKVEFEAYAAPAFARESAWVYEASRRAVVLSADGRTAWFDEDLVSKSYWPCRGTGALEKIDGAWKIRLYSLTFTIPNEATREIRPAVMKHLAPAAKR